MTYSFFLPLTAALWQRRGYDVLCLLVGEAREWLEHPRHRLEIVELQRLGAYLHWIPRFEGHPPGNTAQLVRLFAANLPEIEDDDQLITSDVDMWPFGSWIGHADPSKLQVYGANIRDRDPIWPAPAHYPMCYVSAPAAVWREVMRTRDASIEAALVAALEACVATRPAHLPLYVWRWNYDEILLSQRVTSWDGYPQRCALVERDFTRPGEDNINRYRWTVPASLEAYADAHVVRPGFVDENWLRLRPVLAMALDEKSMTRWDVYHERYLAL